MAIDVVLPEHMTKYDDLQKYYFKGVELCYLKAMAHQKKIGKSLFEKIVVDVTG